MDSSSVQMLPDAPDCERAVSPTSDDYEVISNCDVMSVTTDGGDGAVTPTLEENELRETPVINAMLASFITQTSASPDNSTVSTVDPHMEFVATSQSMADSQRSEMLREQNIAEAAAARQRGVVGMKTAPSLDDMMAMSDEIERLQVQLAAKHALEEEYEHEKEEARNYRRALDESMAKLMTREDEVNHYRQLHNQGIEDVSMPDHAIATLLEEKSREITRLHEEAKRLKCNYDGEKEKAAILSKELHDMNGLMKIVNDQRREDNDYILEVRRIYEERIKLMQEEISCLRSPCQPAQSGGLECPECHARFADLGMFNRHLIVCAAKPEVNMTCLSNTEGMTEKSTGEPTHLLLS